MRIKSKHILYDVQHIHINLSLIHSIKQQVEARLRERVENLKFAVEMVEKTAQAGFGRVSVQFLKTGTGRTVHLPLRQS